MPRYYEVLEPQGPESLGERLKRVGTGVGLSALKGVENIASLVPSLLLPQDSETLKHRRPSEILTQQLPSGYTEPQTSPEFYLQRFAELAPGALGGGSSSLKNLLVGTAGATAAKNLGLGELGQDIAQLATEFGFGRFKGLRPSISTEQQKAYETAREIAGEKGAFYKKPIATALENVKNQLSKETSQDVYNAAQHSLNIIEENLKKANVRMPIKDALDLRRKLGETYNKVPKEARPYIEQLRNSFNDFFAEYAAHNTQKGQQFFKALNKGDQLTQAKHMASKIEDYVDSFLDKVGKYSQYAKTLKITTLPLIESEKFLKAVIEKPAAREHYLKLAQAAYNDNPSLFIKQANKIRSLLPKEEKEPEKFRYYEVS